VDPASKVLRRHVADHHKLASQVDAAMNQQNIEAVKSATAMLMAWFGLIGEQATTAVNEARACCGCGGARKMDIPQLFCRGIHPAEDYVVGN
jgi:hypothetical protein